MINLATNKAFTLVRKTPSFAIVCIKKRVYWLEQRSGATRIFSTDYTGWSKTLIATGFFSKDLLGVFGNLIYFLESNSTSLNEMNISSKNIKREVSLVPRNPYLSMIVVDSSLQNSSLQARERGKLQISKNFGNVTALHVILDKNFIIIIYKFILRKFHMDMLTCALQDNKLICTNINN